MSTISTTVPSTSSPVSESTQTSSPAVLRSSRTPTPPSTPISAKRHFVFASPDINPNENLRRLLADFAQHTGIDVQSEHHVLEFHALGPHSIPLWRAEKVSEWTGIAKDNVVLLQEFCHEWIDALQKKRGLL